MQRSAWSNLPCVEFGSDADILCRAALPALEPFRSAFRELSSAKFEISGARVSGQIAYEIIGMVISVRVATVSLGSKTCSGSVRGRVASRPASVLGEDGSGAAARGAQWVMGEAVGVGADGLLKVGVVGVGVMGSNHARVLSEMSGVQLVGIARPGPQAKGFRHPRRRMPRLQRHGRLAAQRHRCRHHRRADASAS